MTPRYARLALAAAALLAAPLAHGQDGRLDPAFDGDGVAFGPLPSSFAADIALDEQKGAVVVGGYLASNTSSGAFIARYRPDGALDPLFDGDGIATLTFGGTINGFDAVAVDASGRYVVAGDAGSSLIVARFLDDGRLDASFGTGGIRRFFAGAGPTGLETATTIALDGAGAIYVGGTSDVSSPGVRGFVARFTPSGDLDSPFGSDGVVRLTLDGTSIRSVAPTGDGRLAFTGAAPGALAGTTDVLVGRLLASGAPDPSFSFDGLLTVDVKDGDDRGEAILAYPDGALSVVGTSVVDQQSLVAALLLDYAGDRTPGYGTDGLVLIDASPEDDAGTDAGFDAALDADGRLVIAGATRFGDGSDIKIAGVVARLLPSGVRDTAFGLDGLVRTEATPAGDGFVAAYAAVALDKRSGIYVAGQGVRGNGPVAVVSRYTSSRATAGEASPGAGALRLAASPNPASASTRVVMTLAAPAAARVMILDALGREISRLHDGLLAAGETAFALDAARLPAGVYAVVAQTGSARAVQRVTVVR